MEHNPIRTWLGSLRRWAVSARDRLDGFLHAHRRSRARARLAKLAPSSVLFVCLGNVCRSPYGARAMAAGADGALLVDSAGFIGPGRPPPDMALRAARARGIDHSDHVSKTLTAEILESAGVTFVFDRFNVQRLRRTRGARLDRLVWLGDLDPIWTGKRAIIDPWGKDLAEFEATFERIDRCVREALDALSRRGSGTTGQTP